ncbi:hypothetical protein GCM10009700_01700 [Brevibacterium sanguinis]
MVIRRSRDADAECLALMASQPKEAPAAEHESHRSPHVSLSPGGCHVPLLCP